MHSTQFNDLPEGPAPRFLSIPRTRQAGKMLVGAFTGTIQLNMNNSSQEWLAFKAMSL